jgi:hypothetical protein
MRAFMFNALRTERPVRERRDGLHRTAGRPLRERGDSERRVLERSVYTRAAMHPVASRIVGYGFALGAVAALLAARRGRPLARLR